MSARTAPGRFVLLAAITASTCFAMLQSFMAPLLPTLQDKYDLSTTTVAWLMTGYLLSACITAPLLGRLGDIFGHVLLLRIVMAVMTSGMLLQAISWDFTSLLTARFIQGFGGAVMPLCYVILRQTLPPNRIPTALGIVSSMAAFGGGMGLVLVGAIVEVGDFHLAFWSAGAIGVVSTLIVLFGIPHTPEDRGAKRIDVVGAALLAAWLTLILVAISQGSAVGCTNPWILGAAAAAIVAFVGWLRWEQRTPEPIIDIRVMRSRPVVWSNLLAFFFGVMLFTTQVLFPPFLQAPAAAGYGFELSVGLTSLVLVPQTAAFAIGGLFAGTLERKLGSRWSIVLGSALCAAGFAGLLFRHENVWEFGALITFIGVGIGLTYAQLANVVTRSVPSDKVGASTGMNTNIRNIGGAVGTALAAAILVVPQSEAYPPISSYLVGIALLVTVSILATVCAWALPPDRASAKA